MVREKFLMLCFEENVIYKIIYCVFFIFWDRIEIELSILVVISYLWAVGLRVVCNSMCVCVYTCIFLKFFCREYVLFLKW